jgi:hypothetical protein
MNKFVKWTTALIALAAIVVVVYFVGRGVTAKASVIAFTFEINSLAPGTYDGASERLTQQYPMPAGMSEVFVNYTLKNKINTIPGYITATVGASSLLPSGVLPNKVNVLSPNTNFTGEFHGWALPPGKHTLTLTYLTPRIMKGPGNTKPFPDSIIAQATFDYIVPQGMVDIDQDFIDDAVENQLLQTYSPYYRFSIQEDHSDENRPMDVLSFIKFSQMLTSDDEADPPVIVNSILANDPSKIVFDAGSIGPSDINQSAKQTSYYIDPVSEAAHAGANWDAVMQLKNVGLYGHVVPITLARDKETGKLKYNKDDVPAGPLDSANLYYKIEYWQFYGYNKCYCGVANHEGDWTTVQLLYNPRENSIEAVFFYEHGTNEFRYDMVRTSDIVPLTYDRLAGNFRQHRGVNFNLLDPVKHIEVIGVPIHQYVVEFFQDQVTEQFTHPVVFIEVGAHEPWPTPNLRYAIQPNHDGNDWEHCFLTKNIPNLGEVEHPMKWPGAKEIVSFSGNWGANFGGARGPCTHTQWTWPSNSSVRWRIPKLTN